MPRFLIVALIFFCSFFSGGGGNELRVTKYEVEYKNRPFAITLYQYKKIDHVFKKICATDATFCWRDENGNWFVKHEIDEKPLPLEEWMKQPRNLGVWGYSSIYDDGTTMHAEIHFWDGNNVHYLQLVNFFSHELGHIDRAYLKRNKPKNEEEIAMSYGHVGTYAVIISNQIWESKRRIFPKD